MPTNWSTVWSCFDEAAGLKKEDRVLIHAATGGVGLVAVSFALSVGAIVYATAKPGEKQAYLREKMGVTRISTTRGRSARLLCLGREGSIRRKVCSERRLGGLTGHPRELEFSFARSFLAGARA